MAGSLVTLTFFEDFTITGVYMRSINNPGAGYTSTPSGFNGTVEFDTKVTREEGEMNLMYAVSRHFRVFAGYKTQAYTETTGKNGITINPLSGSIPDWNNEFWISGPGAGIAVVVPVAEHLSVSASTSLIYQSIRYQGYYVTYMGVVGGNKITYNYSGIGNNSALVLSWSLPSINTVISLGGRFQYLRYMAKGDAPSLGNDYYYGVTLAAVYYFE